MGNLPSRLIDPKVESYDAARAAFRWPVPERFNIGVSVCDRHADNPEAAGREALIHEAYDGTVTRFTFAQVKAASNRLANVLRGRGIERGDRCAVWLPQRPETALAHLAIYKLGAIAVPMTVLFRRDAVLYRLQNSGAGAIVCDRELLDIIDDLRPELPDLHTVLVVGDEAALPGRSGVDRGMLALNEAMGAASDALVPVDTSADDPCVLIYTSGTTGNPKGALHAHRYLIGHLPGFELSHDFFPQPGDRFYTPADWAWIGGLTDALLPTWLYGLTNVSFQGRGAFDPERMLRLMADHQVRNAFIPPTALKMTAQLSGIRERYDLNLRTLMSGGEALSSDTLRWAEETLHVRINEIYGQTEINYLVGNCQSLWPVRPGSMGRPYPGHEVGVVDEQGKALGAGEVGEVAVRRGEDPVFFLEYWRNPGDTRDKFIGDAASPDSWALTGDLAEMDGEGYFWFRGRKDDVIISAGHRIGPNEIENALLQHPAVALAAVVASPDPLRGHIVKAFIKPAPGHTPSEELSRQIQEFVKETLARHEYPRAIEYLDEFPLTPTGKIRRLELREMEARRAASPETQKTGATGATQSNGREGA